MGLKLVGVAYDFAKTVDIASYIMMSHYFRTVTVNRRCSVAANGSCQVLGTFFSG